MFHYYPFRPNVADSWTIAQANQYNTAHLTDRHNIVT